MNDQEVMDKDKDMNPVLDKNNYEYWKTMSEASLVYLNCWTAIDPGFSEDDRKKVDALHKDNKARAYIFRHVRPEYLQDISDLKSAKEIWEVLDEIHGKTTSMDIVMCLREFKRRRTWTSQHILDRSKSYVQS